MASIIRSMAKTLGSVRSRETSVMQLARSAEVTPTVVRFYMRSGLLPGPHPQPDGRLGYDESDTMRLRLLVTLHRLGIDGAEEVAALAGTTILPTWPAAFEHASTASAAGSPARGLRWTSSTRHSDPLERSSMRPRRTHLSPRWRIDRDNRPHEPNQCTRHAPAGAGRPRARVLGLWVAGRLHRVRGGGGPIVPAGSRQVALRAPLLRAKERDRGDAGWRPRDHPGLSSR